MDSEVKPIVVEILGRSLALRSDMPPERLREVARLVDEQLRYLQRSFPSSSLADLAILAALNLACESLESKEDYQQLRTEIEARSRHLIQLLETCGSEAPPGP